MSNSASSRVRALFGLVLSSLLVFGIAGITGIAAPVAIASPSLKPTFKKVMIVIFENTDYQAALSQPFFAAFAKQGALLTHVIAATHPSQGNYIALTSGGLQGVTSDHPFDLNIRNVVDLLEAQGKTWKVYAEQYPGNCFLGTQSGTYVRKHVPMLSYTDIQTNPTRCAKVVDLGAFESDVQSGSLPDYSLFIPDLNNDGHDTGVAFADHWFSGYFAPLLQDSKFMKDLLVIATFDESSSTGGNHIYTALYGDSVVPGATSSALYNHVSILRTIEDAFGLGTLGPSDQAATPIKGIWK